MARKHSIQSLTLLTMVFATLVLAADTFTPNDQPFGYQVPVALSKADVQDGTAVAYVSWYDGVNSTGELLAAPVSEEGVVDHFGPIWRASVMLDAMHWFFDRRIVTVNDETGLAVPFHYDNLSKDQQNQIVSELVLDYVRGDRSGELSAGLRERSRLLGDIMHSNPVYVGKPLRGFTASGYLNYAAANKDRPGRVYVGANDGMLHAFDAQTGLEEFAYIPSMVIPNLAELAGAGYSHRYFVDGPLVVEDAYFNGAWRTVLVGGLGAGGMGLFALDVTSADVASELDATARVLWEFSDSDTNKLGYTYSRPSIVQMNDGRWAVIVGNGYMSKDGKAALLVIDVRNGSLIREIEVDDNDDNGLSSPTVIDIDGDFKADVAYAGDLNGNLWKFDLQSADPSVWAPAWDKTPLLQTEYDDGAKMRQPITTAPTVGVHPEGGYLVYIATGQMLDALDAVDNKAVAAQAVYGIWDNGPLEAELPLDHLNLLQQSLSIQTHPSDVEPVRTATANLPDWNYHRGWVTRLDAGGLVPGTRVVTDHVLRNGRIQFTTTDPTTGSGVSYLMQLNAYTGGAPSKIVIDVNRDGSIGIKDNVDGDANGTVEDVPADRVVGQYQGFGIASQPRIASIGQDDVAIVNQLYSVLATDNPGGGGGGGEEVDPGLSGGHIDLDTSHEIYDFNDGQTDQHVHEWDDKYNATVVDFFDIFGDGFADIDEPGMPPKLGNQTFIITLANAHLSPGAIVEINGASQPVKDYRAKIKRYLTGNLGAAETFPRYKLTEPTASEALEGIVQLTDFKISFSKDVISRGGVHGTNTGCVKGNEPGQNNEYRNGALTIQALDANDVAGGHTYSATYNAFETGSHAVHDLGYAVSRSGSNDGSLFWEATIFWHWPGSCYGIDDKDRYAQEFEEEVGFADDRGTDGEISSDPPEEPENDGDGDGDGDGSTPGDTPSYDVTSTRIDGEMGGRRSWRELIPDE